MKFTLSWLKEHLDTDASLTEITDTLTMIGLELENVEDQSESLKEFVVGYVVEAKPHPDADRLQVCTVDYGDGQIDVVCGAPNARTGMKGVFAANGSYIPGINTVLKTTKIRGVTSNGMLLSEREMGLSDDHEGIVDLPEDAEVGTPAAAAMGLGDPVIDVGVTPNRGDCLGIRGVARDLAAAGIGTLKPLDATPVPASFDSPLKVHIALDDDHKDACPYFVGRLFRGVKNVESPQWLKDKLLAIGLRPISALVDITNYSTIALCRPLHVFDADKVKGEIHVRMAKPGEKMLALDGKEYELDGEMTVIADDHDAEALAGVMGGERTGCTEGTVNVMLEAAYFDPVRTAMTGRKLNLQSDARFRFERGVDPAFLVDGTEIATRLILELCGGEASEVIIAGGEPDWRRSYHLRGNRVKQLGGVDVAPEKIKNILEILGFEVSDKNGGWDAVVPPWRYDVVGEADLVEEVLRINGFDEIPSVPMERDTVLPHGAVNLAQERRAQARRALAARGLTEAVTFSFLPKAQAEIFGGVPDSIHLVNPISADLDVMRSSILPNLITAAGRNADRGISDVALFEVGPQYAGVNPTDQVIVAAGIRAGNAGSRNWAEQLRAVDVFDAKADVMDILTQLGAPTGSAQITAEAPSWYHPGRSGRLQLGPKGILAVFGEIHPGILKALDVDGPMVGFEIYLDNIPLPKSNKGTARARLDLSPLHSVERDFAFIIEDSVVAENLVKAAMSADKKLITSVSVFDLFTDGALGNGKKSMAITVTLQPTDATLTDAEIEDISDKVVANVAKHTGGVLRG